MLFGLILLAIPGVGVAALAIMWVRLAKATRDIENLSAAQTSNQLTASVAGLRREVDALRAELRGARAMPPEPLPAVTDSSTLRPADGRGDPGQTPVETGRAAARPVTPAISQPLPAAGGLEPVESLESKIGSRWLLYVGVVAIVIGASYFVKLAFENEWIDETTRVIIGAFVGVLLGYGGTRLVRAGYPLYGQMISGAGFAVLYVSIYAAFNFYHLIGQPLAFALLCGVTIAAAWLADRQRSQGLALMAVGGAFATPFMLPSNTDAQLVLFSYDAMLVAGTMYLARRGSWSALNLVSYAGTVLTILVWAGRFYTPDKFLITELFLTAFCAMFLYIVHRSQRFTKRNAGLVGRGLWTAPLWYYVASLAILHEHPLAFVVYLMTLALTGMIVARRLESSLVRLLFWCAVEVPLIVWANEHAGPTWLVGGLAIVAGVYVLTLVSQLEVMVRRGLRLDDRDLGLLHLNALLSYGAAYILIDEVRTAATAPVAAAFALWQLVLAAGLARRDRQDAVHFVALAFTLGAIAVALQFDGAWVVAGWAAEGAALIWVGLREHRGWLRAGGALLLAMAVMLLRDLLFSSPPIGRLVLLNQRAACAAFVVALLYGLARLYHRSAESADSQFRPRSILLVAANALTLLLFTSEIQAFWELRDLGVGSRTGLRTSQLAREAMLSITWAAYATAAIVAGLRRRCAPIRYFAIVIFGITILKVFMVDLAQLDRFYRVLSIVGLGVLLLVTSYLYQRFHSRLAPQEESAT